MRTTDLGLFISYSGFAGGIAMLITEIIFFNKQTVLIGIHVIEINLIIAIIGFFIWIIGSIIESSNML